MARINIEDSLHTDQRFFDLAFKLGDLDRAYGVLVRTWILAQKWYLTPDKMIPIDEWRKQKINDAILDVGLAERVGEFIRVCGADNQFAWLRQRQISGRKSGESRRANSKTNGRSTAVERPFTSVQRPSTGVEPLSLSPSLASHEANVSKDIYISSASKSVQAWNGDSIPKKEVFHDAAQLIDAVPILTRDKWGHRYKDWGWIEEQCYDAFEFHTADPGAIPATRGAWMKKLHTWLENSWAKIKKQKSASLITAEESALLRGEQ